MGFTLPLPKTEPSLVLTIMADDEPRHQWPPPVGPFAS
jgi:hypothetical protein